jgi:hypothetical protein
MGRACVAVRVRRVRSSASGAAACELTLSRTRRTTSVFGLLQARPLKPATLKARSTESPLHLKPAH